MIKVLFYGNFFTTNGIATNGQTSKTINFKKVFSEVFGEIVNVIVFDTFGFKKKPVRKYIELVKTLKKVEACVIFPGSKNSLKIFLMANSIAGEKRAIFYPIVGGWLFDKIHDSKFIINKLKKFDCLYPETKGLKDKLEKIGITNTKVSPTFALRKAIPFEQIKKNYLENCQKQRRFVYFGRITETKGIYLAMKAVKLINQETDNSCILDLYGRLNDNEDYSELYRLSDENIKYRGILPDESIDLLSTYDFFLFPTFYEGEGFPACCVESLMYGTPVLASNWKYNNEIIIDDVNGFLFNLEMDDFVAMIKKALEVDIITLKENSYKDSKKYTPCKAVMPFLIDFADTFAISKKLIDNYLEAIHD